MNKSELLSRVGSIQQIAHVRPIEYREGRSKGLGAVEVKNGPLRFVALVDKALDVSEFEYKGTAIPFLSKPGLIGRNHYDTNGEEAVRSIMGGLFFTAGFENICAPWTDANGVDYPMHGRIRTTPAEHVQSDASWQGDEYVLTVRGEMREAALFGENLVLRRTLSTRLGSAELVVEDEVTNEGFEAQPLLWMYHCNFGWPLVDEGATVLIPSLRVTPRDDDAASDSHPWSSVEAPTVSRPESVFIHDVAAAPTGDTLAGV